MSLNYELFLELYRKKYKNSVEVEIDMISSAKEKYDQDLKKKLDKNDLGNIEVFNYLDNFLIKENTIKFMKYCEQELSSTYSKNFLKRFLNEFSSINRSNKVYLREMNKINDEDFELVEFKDTDFLRISEIVFRALHDTFLRLYVTGKDTKISTLKIKMKTLFKEELMLNNFQKENKNLIMKKIEDSKFSSYDHFKTTLIYTFNKLNLNEDSISLSDDDFYKASDVILDIYLNQCSDLFIKEKIRIGRKDVINVKFSDVYHKKINNLLDKFGETFINFKPLLTEPKPWTSIKDGGYWANQIKFIKSRNKKHLNYIEDNFDLQEEFDACNSLQQTPFRINKEVHEVMYNLFHNNENNKFILKNEVLPTAVIDMSLVSRDAILDREYDDLTKKEQISYQIAKEKYTEESAALFKFKASTNSKRELMKTILKLSAEYYDHNFYYVYTVDTRDRKYPTAKYLNPQGNDYAKGVLQLGKGRKLDEDGLYDYKLHIANIFAINNIDKASEEDKIKWVEKNSSKILAVALDPYRNSFWQNADKPWQALAACFEFEKMKKFGTNYTSHAYCDVDGSNNGLQHYAAMLKDKKTAVLTNIANNEKCEDAYQHLVDHSLDNISKNYAFMTKAEQKMIDKVRVSEVNRKLLKQPIMTAAYAATISGWVNQMMKTVTERINNGGRNMFDGFADMRKSFTCFAEKVLLPECEEELPAAFLAMKNMKKHVKIIHQHNKKAEFMYLNPAGFLVVNNYKKVIQSKIDYRFLTKSRSIYFDKHTEVNELKKLLQAFCPNVVHSIDAAHMTKVINRCKAEGINDFIMVHDSFGCHPNDMKKMKRIVKEEFYNIHQENLLYDIIKQMYVYNDIKFDEEELQNDFKRGDFNLKEVLDAMFAFK